MARVGLERGGIDRDVNFEKYNHESLTEVEQTPATLS